MMIRMNSLNLKAHIAREFEIKHLDPLRDFLRIEVGRSNKGIIISQRKYVFDLLQEASMLGCRLADAPIEVNHKLATDVSDSVDKERYQ